MPHAISFSSTPSKPLRHAAFLVFSLKLMFDAHRAGRTPDSVLAHIYRELPLFADPWERLQVRAMRRASGRTP